VSRPTFARVYCPKCDMPFPMSRFRAPRIALQQHMLREHPVLGIVLVDRHVRGFRPPITIAERTRKRNPHLPTHNQIDDLMRGKTG
jgi:hypothetical protein